MLREMRAEMGDMRADTSDIRRQMATKTEVTDLRSEMISLRADVASDLLATRGELGEKIVGLRRAVVEYHTTVIGHGVLISDLEARVRRLEQHLHLEAPDAH